MKILIISEYFPESSNAERKGGAESTAYYIARELARKHNVAVICSRQPENKKRFDWFENMRVYRVGPNIPYSHHSYVFRRILFCISASLKGLMMPKLNLVHGFSFLSYNIAIFISIFKRIPRVATYHETWVGQWSKNKPGFTGFMGGIFERATLFFGFDHLITVSDFTQNELRRRGVNDKITTVHNGIEINEFRNLKSKKSKDPTVICMSRLTPKKRQSDLIRALAIVKKEIPNIKCIIQGTGDELENLKRLSTNLKLEDNVKFLGFVEKHSDLMKILKNSHVFCLPSEMEGFGIVTIEAMALGVPYVASDIPVIKEVTNNGVGGLLFKVRDCEDLANKILKLIKDKKLYEIKRNEAKELIKKYNWENLAGAVERIYRDVLRKI